MLRKNGWIKDLIFSGKEHDFYVSPEWRRLREEILSQDKHECQICKANGRYTKATHVHHAMHLREHPELALVRILPDGRRNLISVCRICHETVCHPERMRAVEHKEPITVERW